MIQSPPCPEDAPHHPASDRAQLLAVLRLVIVAAIAFVLAAVIWEAIGNHLHVRPEIPEPFSTKINYCFDTGRYDTVFVGSSRYFHGIDPVVFDAETAKAGVATHSFNLGFDALDFLELQFVVDHLLSDPRSHIKTLFVEPSLRVRLAPGLEDSQRELVLHDTDGTIRTFNFIFKGSHDLKRKLFWMYQQGGVSSVRLTNVGAFTNKFIRPEEPAPDPADLIGPMNNGYSGLDPRVSTGDPATAAGIKQMVADQAKAELEGHARKLNAFEIDQLQSLQKLAADHGVKLILLAPMTASPEVYDEFSAMKNAAAQGKLKVPLLSFADPAAYPDLYDPAGFTDMDHVGQPVSEKWTVHVAQAFAKLPLAASRIDNAGSANPQPAGTATGESR
jgi:hypothetical protein